MFDTMTATKTVGALCGAMLVLLLGKWAAESIYHVGMDSHGDSHAIASLFPEPDAHGDAAAVVEAVDIMALLAEADAAKGAKVFAKCKACHKADDAVNGVGPHLVQVIGRAVAAIDDFSYSGPMSEMEGSWDVETLAAFLANPKRFLPGTKMSFVGLKKPKDQANLIAYLQSLQ